MIIIIAYIALGLYGGAPIEEQRRCSGVAIPTGQGQGRIPILNRKTQVSYSSNRGIITEAGGVGRGREGWRGGRKAAREGTGKQQTRDI